MKMHYKYKFLSGLANSLHCKIQNKLKNNWKWNCSNFINNEVKGVTGLLSQWNEKTALILGQYFIFFYIRNLKTGVFILSQVSISFWF